MNRRSFVAFHNIVLGFSALALLTLGTQEPAHATSAQPAAAASAGTQLWVSRYDDSGSIEEVDSLAVSADGTSIYVTGPSNTYGVGDQFATVAYDASTGAQRWVSRYGPAASDSESRSVAVSPDGSEVFVTGESSGGTTGYDYATVAYDAFTGTQLWVSRYNGSTYGDDLSTSLGVSPDGTRVFVTGESGSTTVTDYATVAYDTSTGAQVWVRRYNGPANDQDRPTCLKVSRDGTKIFVTGNSRGSNQLFDYATVAYQAATGAQLWVRRYNGPAHADDFANALSVSPDGARVFVTGQSAAATNVPNMATVAYDATTGAQLWVRRLAGPTPTAAAGAVSVLVSPDGSRVFVTGSSVGPTTSPDWTTVAYDAITGKQMWVNRYNGVGYSVDQALASGVSADGTRIFVTGVVNYDEATGAFDASTGARLWVRRYNGSADGDDEATSLAVSPDGTRVYVAGGTNGGPLPANEDFLTIAYATG